eukprot:scaffold7473_cov403-Prasinococcus_capsulatus_cf.AAC.5
MGTHDTLHEDGNALNADGDPGTLQERKRFTMPLSNKGEILLRNNQLLGIDGAFWQRFTSLVGDPALKMLWVEKFKPTLSHRPVWRSLRAPGWEKVLVLNRTHVNTVLHRDKRGFKLSPTPSQPNELVKIVYYLPGDDSNSDAGIQLLSPKLSKLWAKKLRQWKSKAQGMFSDLSYLDVDLTVPFIRNSLLAFAPCVGAVSSFLHAMMRPSLVRPSTRDLTCCAVQWTA